MGTKGVKKEQEKTVIVVEELKRYGEEDVVREITIPHNAAYQAELETISKERIENLNDDPHKGDIEKLESINIPEVGTVYFLYSFDNEYSSATYRMNAHDVSGPYVMEEK